jgi:hypothetical protein
LIIALKGNDGAWRGIGGPSGGVPHYLQRSARAGIAASGRGKAKAAPSAMGRTGAARGIIEAGARTLRPGVLTKELH